MAELEHFGALREDLDDALPAWWAHRDPSSEAYKTLQVLADLGDELAAHVEQLYDDMALETAGDAALRSEWAVLYGAGNESLGAMPTELLRHYLKCRAEDDGSTAALVDTLVALTHNTFNDNGTVLTFAPDGSGVTFPATGGLALYEPVDDVGGLVWPVDGTGLAWPADGSGLAFPPRGRIEVIEHPSDNRVDVNVREILSFDRALFARAVARARMAHNLPSTITEVR